MPEKASTKRSGGNYGFRRVSNSESRVSPASRLTSVSIPHLDSNFFTAQKASRFLSEKEKSSGTREVPICGYRSIPLNPHIRFRSGACRSAKAAEICERDEPVGRYDSFRGR